MKKTIDLSITLLLWAYFTIGFVLFFSPFYFYSYLFAKNRPFAFQRLNHRFYRGFFRLLQVLNPMQKWDIKDEVRHIRSAVIVCNHLSYLDPLLMMALFEKHKTIVKSRFFKLPIFRAVIKHAGYIPSHPQGKLAHIMIQNMETREQFLADGGNIFIFPEGTRSRNGTIGDLNQGAIKIARYCHAPIKVLYMANTDKLFYPGSFLFNTWVKNTISIKLIGTIEADAANKDYTVADLTKHLKKMLEIENRTLS